MRTLISLLLTLAVTAPVFSQAPTQKQRADSAPKLRSEAVELLRETSNDINMLRSVENRISFNSEVAALMWHHDEKEARTMFDRVVADFRQLLLQIEQTMSAGADLDAEESMGIFFGAGRANARKMTVAQAVRQQIALALAENDPDLAYRFFLDSVSVIQNPAMLEIARSGNDEIEAQLLRRIAETDLNKGMSYGLDSLKRGVNQQHLQLLKRIHEKDAEKGAEFAGAVLSAFKSSRSGTSAEYVMYSFLDYGGDMLDAANKGGGKKPAFTAAQLRELAELLADSVLAGSDDEGYLVSTYLGHIARYSPGRAGQIRRKFDIPDSSTASILSSTNVAANAMPRSISTSRGGANSNSSTATDLITQRDNARKAAEKQLLEGMEKLSQKTLPADEREKVVAQARKILSETPGREKKVLGLTTLAASVARHGDKDLAEELMRDAAGLVNQFPKNYQDYMFTWMLIAGYAEVKADKAFPLLESAVLRANDTLAAFVKVAEFIDIQEEIVADGEIQVGLFGGPMVREFTNLPAIAGGTIRYLADADFDRMRTITNRFDRVEVRVLAKVMVLRTLLRNSASAANQETGLIVGESTDAPPPPPPPARRQPLRR